jgi:spore coat protein H
MCGQEKQGKSPSNQFVRGHNSVDDSPLKCLNAGDQKPRMLLPIAARKILGGLAAIVLSLALAQAKPADAKAKPPKTKRVSPTEDLFTNTQIFRIQIEIPEAGMETLREYHWGGWGGPQEKRTAVKGTVREGEKVYKDVAIHLKGAAGSFRSVDDDPALTLHFDKYVKGQTFHGLQRISLNNSVQDRSLLNEQICRELFAAGGVPVPRATHAKVQLNGRDLGVYVLVEAFNKQFLARHFKNPNGNLYDGGFLKDVTDPLDKSSGANPEDRADLKRLADAAMDPNYTNRLARLDKVLDLDRFITYLALDVMMCDWDGYGMNRNNYRIYHDPDSDKIVFMPHGLDQMFGVMRAGTDMPIFPRMQGLVARAVLQTPDGRQRHRDRISQLMTNLFNVASITNRAWELEATLRPVLAEAGAPTARFQEREVNAFCRRIVERGHSLDEQLAAPARTLKFDAAGVVHFSDWQQRTEFGKPVLSEATEGGKKVLHISAGTGSSVGVWFTKVRLEPGQYRLEGRVKSKGVTPDPGDRKAGAGLRISGRRFTQKLTGDGNWTEIAFDFEVQDQQSDFGFMAPVQDDAPEIELICELRAATGEAWFDRESLRLRRR